MKALFVAGALAGVTFAQSGTALRARIHVTDVAASLVTAGIASPAPAGAAADGFEVVPAPALRNVQNEAIATTAPWIDSNAWRYLRGLRRATYATIPG
jgi:hypothetical protein